MVRDQTGGLYFSRGHVQQPVPVPSLQETQLVVQGPEVHRQELEQGCTNAKLQKYCHVHNCHHLEHQYPGKNSIILNYE